MSIFYEIEFAKYILPYLSVIAVIWWHSMQNGVASHAESRRMLAFALSHLQGTRLASYLSDGHIRRLAHLTEYTTLGVVLSSFFCFNFAAFS